MPRPSSLAGSGSPLALLNRDSEYLHRQCEGATGARSPCSVQRLEALRRQLGGGSGSRSPSAVERLEADKAKYVKTQQVVNSKQDPALITTPSCTRKLLTVWSEPGPHCATSTSKATSSRQGSVLRRSSGRRLMRPDSLIMYRQQRDSKSVNKENASGLSMVRRLFQGSLRERDCDTMMDPAPFEGNVPWTLMEKARGSAAIITCSSERADIVSLGLNLTAPQSPTLTPWSPHPRTHSHQSSAAGHLPQCLCPHSPASAVLQYGDPFPHLIHSKDRPLDGSLCGFPLNGPLSPLEKEQFFNCCGLDDLDLLNKQGAALVTDLDGTSSVSSLESRPNAHSQDSALDEASSAEEDLQGKTRSPISIIERNARVIRWLYSCQKAQNLRKKTTRQDSTKREFIKLESTV